MTMRTTFVVQTFAVKRKRLIPGDRQVSASCSRALKRAEAMAERMLGTTVLQIVADDETGEFESATILGQFGEVPDDFA
ncbi:MULTISPECIES: hypothetical protein [Methylorubrum]|uniref:hypothetical protein n=1 Tax=Methylorubrum TaxID=2282523 RepID=UPI00209D3E5D|nr:MULTISPECIES: hypothetical protein [Methylorubrum]